MQILGSKRINSVLISATTVHKKIWRAIGFREGDFRCVICVCFARRQLANIKRPENGTAGKKTNKHKQTFRGIVPEMGGGQIVYVFPFFLGKKGNT